MFFLPALLLSPVYRCAAIERRAAVIKTSDGVELHGEVWFNNGQLKIYEGENADGGRYVKVVQNELVSIVFSTKTVSMERPWRFKNAGSDEKEYLDGEYPLIELKSEIALSSGQVLRGHLMSMPVSIRVQSRENAMDYDTKKFLLKYQYKGEVGQAVKDIAYVTSIVFDGAAALSVAAGKGSISASVKGLGKLEQAAAYGIKRGRAYPGKIDASKGTLRIEDLPEDVYDISVLTDTGIYVGLSDVSAAPKDDPRPLETGDGEAINKQVVQFRDFFDEQKVIAVKGDRNAAKVLVYQARKAPIYDQQSLGNKELHRLDIWNWHMRQTEWSVDASQRANLFRYEEVHGGPGRPIKFIAKFGALIVSTTTKQVDVSEGDVDRQ